MDDELQPTPTLHEYVNQMILLTGEIMEISTDLAVYDQIDEICCNIDRILMEIRHAKWVQEIG